MVLQILQSCSIKIISYSYSIILIIKIIFGQFISEILFVPVMVSALHLLTYFGTIAEMSLDLVHYLKL